MACTFFSLSYALSWLCYTGHKCYNLYRYVTYSKVWLPCLVFKWCWPCLHFMNDIYSKCISKKFLIKIYILLCKLNSVVSKMMIVFFFRINSCDLLGTFNLCGCFCSLSHRERTICHQTLCHLQHARGTVLVFTNCPLKVKGF